MNRSVLNSYIFISISVILAIIIISVLIYVFLSIKNNKELIEPKKQKSKEEKNTKMTKNKFKVNSNALKFKNFDESKDFKIENVVNDDDMSLFEEFDKVSQATEEKLTAYNKKNEVKKSFKDFRRLK